MRAFAGIILLLTALSATVPATAASGIQADGAALFLDFSTNAHQDLPPGVRLVSAAFGHALEFSSAMREVTVPKEFSLEGAKAVSVGGWFFPRQTGEQYFFCRGLPEIAPQGERLFPRNEHWVNFVLGTDQRGFLLGTINGNGSMPFPHVTIEEVPFDEWNQLVIVKDARGFQKFYRNGILVHTDEHSNHGGKAWPFHDAETAEKARLGMPLGGLIGEAWVFPRELTPEEIHQDFELKRARFKPALPAKPVLLREMNSHPAVGLWPQPPTTATWPALRSNIVEHARKVLGPFPDAKPPLDPMISSETDCGSYLRRKISIQVQPGDRMPAYLLVPKKLAGRVPAIICFYGTSAGAGKDTTVGLSGLKPGTPPQANRSFAVDMVEAGFVAIAPDYLRDGERIKPGRRPYETTDFYAEFPDWSIHGKDIWDTSRAIDYLETLLFVDNEKIGMVGHSYGGHSTIFAAAMEPRIKVAVANGPVSDFLHHGMHWGVPKGGSNSQSLPAMRPYVMDHTIPAPITFYEFTALIAPRPLWVGQAAGERRPMEEENCAAVKQVYSALGIPEKVRYSWYAGDHDFPPEARKAAVEWFRTWFGSEK